MDNKKISVNLTDGLFRQNVVVSSGLAAFPVIAIATTLKNAIVLSVGFTLITVLSVIVSSFISRKIIYAMRIALFSLISSVIYIPVALFLRAVFPSVSVNLGMYLPILVVNSVILSKSESRFHHLSKAMMSFDVLIFCFGFSLAAMLVGAIREVVAYNTIFDYKINMNFEMASASQPFFGFILIGCLSALTRLIIHKNNPKLSKEKK